MTRRYTFSRDVLAANPQLSQADREAIGAALNQTPPRYPNQRCEHQGIRFDSLTERDVWIEAELRQRGGQIRNLVPSPAQPKKRRFELQGGVLYTPDMTYEELRGGAWVQVAVDVKGKPRGRGSKGTLTREFVRAAKQFRAAYPDWVLVVEER